jgi:hypothetical protein
MRANPASQDHGVAMPCAGYWHPGPMARHGGGETTVFAGRMSSMMGSCDKGGTEVGTGLGSQS